MLRVNPLAATGRSGIVEPVDELTQLAVSMARREAVRVPTFEHRSGRSLSVLVVSLVLVGCGTSEPADQATTSIPPASMAATTTIAPPATSVPAAGADAIVGIPGPGEPWDVLMLTHPRYVGVETAERYGELIEETLGVEVRVEQPGGIEPFAAYFLGHMRNDRHPGIADLVRQAEIIVIAAFPQRSDGGLTHIDDDANNCAYSFSPELPAPIGPGYWDVYHAVLDDLYAEAWRLREGAPTVLIAADYPNVHVDQQREAGIFAACSAWVDSWSVATQGRADLQGAVFVSANSAVGGPERTVDPVATGFTGPSDAHPALWFGTPNEVGSAMIADALIDAGLDPVVVPGR